MSDGNPGLDPGLRTLFAGLEGTDAGALDPTIHPQDGRLESCRRFYHGARQPALVEYFRSGHHAWGIVDEALRALLGPRYPRNRPGRILEVGAGYGRITRFMLPAFGTDRVVSSDTDPAAVKFLHQHFGVPTVLTPFDPGTERDLGTENLQPGGFDLILALSVLTHLPEESVVGWLRRWLDALTVEGGVLVFTTLGPSTLLPGRKLHAVGFHFESGSASHVLAPADEGTAWVHPGWMGRTLDRLTGGLARWHHLPRALWQQQDLWFVTLDPRLEWRQDLAQILDRPGGALEQCQLTNDGCTVTLSGWASGGRLPPRAARVELFLDGQRVAECQTSGQRADVGSVLAGPADREIDTAFSIGYEAEAKIDPRAQLRIDVVDDVAAGRAKGHRFVLHAGSLEATELLVRLQQAHGQVDHYRQHVEIFETSRFGRWRRHWMTLKSSR